jgi:hypothetical protein
MSYLPSSPDLTNIAAMLGKYPRRGILLFKLLEDIKSSCSPLNRSMCELIITFTSGLNQCDFCYTPILDCVLTKVLNQVDQYAVREFVFIAPLGVAENAV